MYLDKEKMPQTTTYLKKGLTGQRKRETKVIDVHIVPLTHEQHRKVLESEGKESTGNPF